MKKLLSLIILCLFSFSCKTTNPLTIQRQYEIEDSLLFNQWLLEVDSTLRTIQKDTAWQ